MSLAWSETPKTGFLASRPICHKLVFSKRYKLTCAIIEHSDQLAQIGFLLVANGQTFQKVLNLD